MNYQTMGKEITENCKNGDCIYCGIRKRYYPFTDSCPLDGGHHEENKEDCPLFLDGKCMYAEYRFIFTGMTGNHDIWVGNDSVRIILNMIQTIFGKEFCLSVSCYFEDERSEFLTQKILESIGLKENYNFKLNEIEDFKDTLGKLIQNIPLIESMCKNIVCSKCGANRHVKKYGDNLLCEDCEKDILINWVGK